MVVDATPRVVMVNVVLLEPAGMRMLAGIWAAATLLLLSVTNAPAGGAAPFSVTVPVELFPPTTLVGDRVKEDKVAGLTVRVAVLLTPNVAVMTVVDVEPTPKVVTVKVAEVAPASTVTLAGTVAAAVLLLLSETETPPVGAAVTNRTVPVELLPPTRLVGLRDTEDTEAAGFTVSVAPAAPP